MFWLFGMRYAPEMLIVQSKFLNDVAACDALLGDKGGLIHAILDNGAGNHLKGEGLINTHDESYFADGKKHDPKITFTATNERGEIVKNELDGKETGKREAEQRERERESIFKHNPGFKQVSETYISAFPS